MSAVVAQRTAPYGAWRSPITADLIASSQISLGGIAIDGDEVYWLEARPTEAGRNVIVRRGRDGAAVDVTPKPFSARSRVHEYGGGSFAVSGGLLCFANFTDQQIYLQENGAAPRRITFAGDAKRYADFTFDLGCARLICVCEDHDAGGSEPRNSIVAVRLDGGGVETIAAGHDFYSTPRVSRDGTRLAWLTWDHPLMPWDGSQLWVAEIVGDGTLRDAVLVAGGESESIVQPEWSPGGDLFFVSDRSGWWNLYRRRGGEEAVCVHAAEADYGMPQWIFGQSSYAFASPTRVVAVSVRRAVGRLELLDLDAPGRARVRTIELPFTDFSSIRAAPGRAYFRAAGPRDGGVAVALDLGSGAHAILRRSSEVEVDPDYISTAETIEFPTAGGAVAHGFFYAPRNRGFVAPAGELPPLLVMSHGGPTSSTSSSLSLRIQYWTSRGIAVLDVNYRGSTGYGRAYRELLKGQWGVADVDDCVHGALALVDAGRVDSRRLAITGGSAGGYTTLCALTFRDVFHAGASYYGIGDLEALARDTHKFESRYEDGLVGPYPERRDLYRERSPIHFTDRLSCPVIFFQGLDDHVVPPNQAEAMVESLRAKGLAVEHLTFAGEAHGFRKSETIRRCLDAELAFYARVFGFDASRE